MLKLTFYLRPILHARKDTLWLQHNPQMICQVIRSWLIRAAFAFGAIPRYEKKMRIIESFKNAYNLSRTRMDIVFYAEAASDYLFLEPVLSRLLAKGRKVTYITSAPSDPLLTLSPPGLSAYFIQDGGILGFFFQNAKADMFVTTVTDLGSFYFKKSAEVGHYCYIFHSLNSAHMVYRRDAFRHYDSILCPGPHIMQEIQAIQKHYQWPACQLVAHGYGKLDNMMEKKKQRSDAMDDNAVLVAPSWGKDCLIESGLVQQLIPVLLAGGYRVVLQPHPMTLRSHAGFLEALRKQFESTGGFTLNPSIASEQAFFTCGHLITDWSGIGYEYAFTHRRPVCYVDTATPKCRNDEFKAIGITPREISIRDEIGIIVPPEEISNISGTLASLQQNRPAFERRIDEAASRTVYPFGDSGQAGADYILKRLESAQ
jgi:YidC/Oxa1 family membrane protein insertase